MKKIIENKKEKDKLLRAPRTVGRRNSNASRRGKEGLESCRNINGRHQPHSTEGGEEPAVYVTPDLSYDYRETKKKGR